MAKHIIFYLIVLWLGNSCTKDDLSFLIKKDDPLLENYAPNIRFDVSNRLLENKNISCIETDSKGNVWIASGFELYHFNNNILVETDILEFPILDMSCAGDESLWIGTKEGGLAHLKNHEINWYTKEKNGLPRDYIKNVLVAWDGRVWFSSCASDLGGLLVFDGTKFKQFTPENSLLKNHVVGDIDIDHKGNLYFYADGGTRTSIVYNIADNSPAILRNVDSTFYWIKGFGSSPAGIIYLVEDFTLAGGPHPNIYEYKYNVWRKLQQPDFYTELGAYIITFTALKVDKRNYCWLAQLGSDRVTLRVYNGNSWVSSQEGLFPSGGWISCINTDYNNNIWIGTTQHGVFILNQ